LFFLDWRPGTLISMIMLLLNHFLELTGSVTDMICTVLVNTKLRSYITLVAVVPQVRQGKPDQCSQYGENKNYREPSFIHRGSAGAYHFHETDNSTVRPRAGISPMLVCVQ